MQGSKQEITKVVSLVKPAEHLRSILNPLIIGYIHTSFNKIKYRGHSPV